MWIRAHEIASPVSERKYAQLWMPGDADKRIVIHQLSVVHPGDWTLLFSSHQLGNRPFSGSPVPDGLDMEGNGSITSAAQVRDERSNTVYEGAQIFQWSGNLVSVFDPGQLMLVADSDSSIMIRTAASTNKLLVSWLWDEPPVH